MAKWKFRVSYLQYGIIDVIADSKEEAKDKAWQMKGEFYELDGEVTDIEDYR